MNLAIFETHHQVAFTLKNAVALEIVFGLLCVIVMSTVEFNNQSGAVFNEIENVSTKRDLAAKMMAFCIQVTKLAPERLLEECCFCA